MLNLEYSHNSFNIQTNPAIFVGFFYEQKNQALKRARYLEPLITYCTRKNYCSVTSFR